MSKPVTDNLTLKGRYRGQDKLDRFQLGYDYKNGMLLSSGDIFYDSVNGTGHDTFHAELFPVGTKIGPVTFKYYFEYVETLGDVKAGEKEQYFDHQLRVYAPLYTADRFSLSTEGRFSFYTSQEYNGEANAKQTVFDDFGNNRVYLKANYAMTENLNVYANYFYQFRDSKYETAKKDNVKSYTSNLVLGWSYKF